MTCPTCGEPVAEGVRYCGACGSPVGTRAVAETTVASPTETERRLVSVLFADLVGFTGWAEERDPEEVRDLLTAYFDEVRATIARYGGRVEKFIGDAVMAVWGAPVAYEDDAERAVRAALDIVSRRGVPSGRPGTPALEVRAGVATGQAAVTRGLIGQGMVAGDVVNTAARLQAVAEPGTVLTEEVTQRLTRLAIALEPLGPMELRNRREAVATWRAVRVVAGRGGEGRAERLEAPLVGRAAELRALIDAYHRVAEERRAELVTVVGQGGSGKSRLAWELQKYLDGLVSETHWHRASTPAYGERLTYAALAEMVRQRAGVRVDEPRRASRDRLRACLGRYARSEAERRRLEGPLAALVGLPSPPIEDRDELFAAWHTFFERLAERRPTVLVFDDAQRADDALLDFIERLVEWPRTGPLLVVVLARPSLLERRPGWTRASPGRSTIELRALHGAAMRRLLRALVPGLPERIGRSVRQRAQGVPLYAVEIVRMLADRGQLEARDGAFELRGRVDELDLPETIHALMAARLDALDDATRSVIRDAAVIGPRFSVNALAAVSGRGRVALYPALESLVRAELLSPEPARGRRPPAAYRFTEWAAQEVALATLSRRARRPRHIAAARYHEAMEDPAQLGIVANQVLAAYRTEPPEPEAGELAGWASRALRAAAERAMQLHAPAQALAHLQDALAIVRGADERAELWEQAAAAAESAARHDLAEGFLRDAIRYHRRRRAADGTVSRLVGRLGGVLLMRYRVRDARRLLRAALTTDAARRPDDPQSVALMARLARAHSLLEERDQAVEWSARALEGARRFRLPGVAAESMMTVGAETAFSRDTRAGLRLMRRAVATAERNGLVVAGVRARVNVAAVLLFVDPRAALSEARQGLTIAGELGLRDLAVRLTSVSAGDAALDTGDWDWALSAIGGLELEDLPLPDAVDLASAAALVAGWRGDRSARARLRALTVGVDDPDPLARAILAYREAGLDLAQEEPAAALQRALTAARLLTDEGYRFAAVSLGWTLVARAGTWLGDATAVRTAVEKLDEQRLDTRWWRATSATMRAGLRSLEGDSSEAARLYALGARRWAGLRLPLRLALCRVDQSLAGAGDASRARRQAREIFERLGATAFVAALDHPRPLADGATAGSRRTARTAGGRHPSPPGRARSASPATRGASATAS